MIQRKQVEIYITHDGKQFASYADAFEHEKRLEAVELIEYLLENPHSSRSGAPEALAILCERTRTLLQMEVAQESLCETCTHLYRSSVEYPCNVCDRDVPEKNMWEAK